MNNTHSIRSLINAGHVRRAHTLPGSDYQTTGHHSFEVALLVEYIYPDCTKAALLKALTHDSAEALVGDVPGPTKWENPELAAVLAAAELRFEVAHGIDYDLDPIEEMAVKTADLLSLYLYSQHQIHLGNRYFEPFLQRIEVWFMKHPAHLNTFPKAKDLIYP